jgi:hypothetical protein
MTNISNGKNIRNSRRNYARPSGKITSVSGSTSSPTVIDGSLSTTITINTTSAPTLGPVSTGEYVITSTPAAVNTTVSNTSTSFIATITFPTGSASGSYSINVAERNYNGTGKPTVVTNAVTGVPQTFSSSVLVLGGGGGGGDANSNFTGAGLGGGGGAGAYREFSDFTLLLGVAVPIRIGSGGASAVTGNPSIFSTITAGGGGAGAQALTQNNATAGFAGQAGGSGGGAGGNSNFTANRSGGVYSAPNSPGIVTNKELYTTTGSNGGDRLTTGGSGGGGAGGAGSSDATSSGGAGGAGRASSITGSSVTRGGGGGAPNASGGQGTGGSGGGGSSGTLNSGGNFGGTNLGAGGGGGWDTNSQTRSGGNGGSGVVIIRIPSTFNATFSAGVTSSLITSVAGFKIYSVTATSTTSETVTFSAA